MAKSMIDAPRKPKKIKPESGLERRNSTGGAALIFSEPIPIPNYLRASIGSCHDLCKYGSRRDSSAESASRNTNMGPEPKSNTNNNRGKNMPKSITNNRANSSAESASTEQRRNTNNSAPSGTKRQSTCNARVISRNNEGKRGNSSARIPTSKTRRSKSVPRARKVPKLLESSECCKENEHCDQTVEEKIINVVETNEDVDDQNEKMRLKREGVVEDIINWKDIRLRRVVSEGDSDHMKKECMRIVVMGKNKVRALVDTFETLMSTPDSEGSRACEKI